MHRPPQQQTTGEKIPEPLTRPRLVIFTVSGLVKDLWAHRKKRRPWNLSENKKNGNILQTGWHSCLFPSVNSVTLLPTQAPHTPNTRCHPHLHPTAHTYNLPHSMCNLIIKIWDQTVGFPFSGKNSMNSTFLQLPPQKRNVLILFCF